MGLRNQRERSVELFEFLHAALWLFESRPMAAAIEDDLAMLQFGDNDYRWVTEQVKEIADRHAEGRIVSLLEGGYSLGALGRSAVQHIRVLAGLNA